MVDFLVEKGHSVTVMDNLSTGKIENLNKEAEIVYIDISDSFTFSKIREIVESRKIDYVIHMAAIPNVQQSMEDPFFTNKNNFQGTLNILEACRGIVKKIVFSSTSAIYGDTNEFPTTEEAKESPMSPYGLQKLMGEKYIKLYSDLGWIKGVCLRYFNVFGERMTNEGAYKSVISVFREQKEKDIPLTITNDGNQKRDFIYVGDVVKANYLSCIEETGDFEIFNIGFGENISVNEISGYFSHPTEYIGKRIEPFQTLCSSEKAKQKMGWTPTVTVKSWLNSINS